MFSGIAQMCTYWHGKNIRRDSPGVDPGDNSFMDLCNYALELVRTWPL